MSDQGRLVADRYLLVERVGSGGMGTVWRAQDRTLGRPVAVKKLHVQPHLLDDEVQRLHERTRREARAAARITHPNVITVHDVLDDEGLPCIVMEYVPSVTLGEMLRKRGALPPGEAARVGQALAAALRAAHDAGVLHRDVKPANVLLADDGRIVLTDFGIAMEAGASSLTRTGELIGSLEYLAPERLRPGGTEPGPASDLWSLGATLYQAVEGRQPFRRDSPIETAYAIAAGTHEPPSHAGELTAVIEALLVEDPAARPDAAHTERLLGAVTRAAGDDAATLPQPTGGPAPAPRRRQGPPRRALLAAVAVVVAAAVAGGAWWWARGDDSGRAGTPPHTGASSSRPVSTPPATPPVPDGHHLEDVSDGFSVPVPDGWSRSTTQDGEVVFVDPSDLVGLRVNTVPFAGPDPLRHWRETEEDQTARDNPGYRRERMSATTFRGRQAGYWEFTFDGRERRFRGAELAFADAEGTQYVVYLSAPDSAWQEYRPVLTTAVNGIRLDEE